MLQTVHNSEFSRTMDLFKEIDDLSDLFFPEKNSKLSSSSPEGGYEVLQSKYSSLHENYAKEIENSKKVETCLIKCLKFYSKLCKKYEMQQKIISNLEETLKEKIRSLEEAQKNEERLKGVIEVYRTERVVYAGQTSQQLREQKEMLLDVCCKLISESVKSNNTSVMSKLILRKFRQDLSDKDIFMLREKSIKFDYEKDFKQELTNLDEKTEVKSEDKYSSELTKEEKPDEDTKHYKFDLTPCKKITEESSLDNCCSDGTSFAESETDEPVACSLPPLEEFPVRPTGGENQEADIACCQPPFGEVRPFPQGANDEEQQEADVACCPPPSGELPPFPQSVEDERHRGDATTNECDMSQTQSGCRVTSKNSEAQSEPGHSDTPAPGLCPYAFPAKSSASIFDISDVVPTSDSRTDYKEEIECSDVVFEGDHRVEDLCFVNNTKSAEKSDQDSVFPYELTTIFREMSSIRVLSPIRVSNVSVPDKTDSGESKRKANGCESSGRSKRFKSEEENPRNCLLDSILSAMSVQNEEFKSKTFPKTDSGGESGEGSSPRKETSSEVPRPVLRTYARRKKAEVSTAQENVRQTPGRRKDGIEKSVAEEINNFVAAPISCKEDADRNVKQCVAALANKPEDVIAKCIVTMVLENVDEAVEIFERPAPPLTKTQHRLIVLLSVFRTLEWDTEKISTQILSIIQEKLFPDNFFWPDDSVEAASRFYAALCKARNDPKTLWRFCLTAMTDMRQRCPVLFFTVLRTWPDVLHDASALKGNILALTVVNIFLHMPKTEGLRNVNQSRKLVALKHLLNNFYQFKVEETIEGYAKKVAEGIRRQEVGAEKALVLLAKCRNPDWTAKNLVPALKSSLADWSEGKVDDSVARVTLSVVRQISPVLATENGLWEKVRELAHCLTEILTSGKKSHNCEVHLVEALLQLKKYPGVRVAICEWIPKEEIGEALRSEIIDASAEKVLRELKQNRRKEPKKSNQTRQWKKTKGLRKKGGGKKKKKKKEKKP